MRLVFKEGPNASINDVVVDEVNSLQVEDFEVVPYREDESGDDAPALIVEDESGNETARFTNFGDMGELTDFIWSSF